MITLKWPIPNADVTYGRGPAMDILLYIRAENARRERQLRGLLEQWVSGLEPSLAIDEKGDILGLVDANTQIGDDPYIFRGRRP